MDESGRDNIEPTLSNSELLNGAHGEEHIQILNHADRAESSSSSSEIIPSNNNQSLRVNRPVTIQTTLVGYCRATPTMPNLALDQKDQIEDEDIHPAKRRRVEDQVTEDEVNI